MSGFAGYRLIVSCTAGLRRDHLFRLRIIEIGEAAFACAPLSCTIYTEADRRVAMGKIRAASAMTSSIKDVVSHGLRRDPGLGGDRMLPATGHEGRENEIETVVEFDRALDSSRSRGYGRYEI
jgi:hypothetical protein